MNIIDSKNGIFIPLWSTDSVYWDILAISFVQISKYLCAITWYLNWRCSLQLSHPLMCCSLHIWGKNRVERGRLSGKCYILPLWIVSVWFTVCPWSVFPRYNDTFTCCFDKSFLKAGFMECFNWAGWKCREHLNGLFLCSLKMHI